MARTTPERTTPNRLAPLLLGLTFGFATPTEYNPVTHILERIENWTGTIVLKAVHQHWQYVDQMQLMRPALTGPSEKM